MKFLKTALYMVVIFLSLIMLVLLSEKWEDAWSIFAIVIAIFIAMNLKSTKNTNGGTK